MAELVNEPQLHSASLIFTPSIGKHELSFARWVGTALRQLICASVIWTLSPDWLV